MAEKRRPGFNIPLNFYDGPEVESIPKRIRAAAIGVWALAGNYAATQLTDGYVGAGLLKQFGCTGAIRAALMVTINKKGELSPLWIDARNGGVLLTNWPKHQRTNDEVTTYRASEAERKRDERASKRGASTSNDAETSGRTSNGQNPDVRSDPRDPKPETETKTETEDSGYVPESAALNVDPTRAEFSTPVTQSASRLVNDIIGSGANGYSATVLAKLRINASQLAHEVGPEVTAEALRVWKTKAHLGPDALSSLTAEAAKTIHDRNQPGAGKPASKLRTIVELANEVRAAELENANIRGELT